MEHHSNDLPWRNKSKTLHINILQDGRLDLDDLETKLKNNVGKVKLVAITGCSNVTGIINDIHSIASLTHKYDGKILVDGAQLIPHRKVNMKGYKNDDYIDFLVLSAHKMYAPFGTGVLIGPKTIFQHGEPEYVGGGTIISVTQFSSFWADLPDKEEAGSPNVVGAVALSKAIKVLEEIGMDAIKDHEKELTKYFIDSLKSISGIKIYSPAYDSIHKDVVGVISLNLSDISHNLLSSLLSYEGGIGVRSGCFCAHPYIHKLLQLTPRDISRLQEKLILGNYQDTPGLVRVSFGLYNNKKEIDQFISTFKNIISNKKDMIAKYEYDLKANEYKPKELPRDMFLDFSL